MKMGKVKGMIVATQKDENLIGCKLLIIERINTDGSVVDGDEVAVDMFGAGIGELVLLCSGSSAKSLMPNKNAPIDLVVVGIIDSIEVRQ